MPVKKLICPAVRHDFARYGRECLDKHIAFHADIRSGIIDFIADADITSLFCNLFFLLYCSIPNISRLIASRKTALNVSIQFRTGERSQESLIEVFRFKGSFKIM